MTTERQPNRSESKKRKFLRFIIIGLLAAGALFYFVAAASQTQIPSYRGKTLDQWLEMKGGIEPLPPEAQQAVQQMGTNALPRLLEMLVCEESAAKSFLYRITPNIGSLRAHIVPHYVIQDRGVEGLKALGPKARPALSYLSSLYAETGALEVAEVLVAIGPDGVHVVETGLTNADSYTRGKAIMALSQEASTRLDLRYAFQKALSDRDEFVREAATNALADIK